MCKISRNNHALFYTTYFSLTSLLKLNLALRQTPCLYLNDFDWSRENDSQTYTPSRNLLTLTRTAGNGFEDYLQRRLPGDLPYTIIEGFTTLLKRVKQIPFRPKVIFTANAHWNNELFKIYSAEQFSNRGAKFVTMTHGGAIPPLFSLTNFEEEIADLKTTWALPYHSKHVQLPPNKLVGQKEVRSSKEYCAVTTVELPRYFFQPSSAPIAGQVLTHYYQICDFFEMLNHDIQKSVQIKPYVKNLGWDTKQRFIDTFGAEKVSTTKNFVSIQLLEKIQ
jgi:putative transferase (TIGR04331 family)